MENKTILLPNGHSVPLLGLGSWKANPEELEKVLDIAFEAGYRHFDTAPVYGNEKAIGNVLKRWLDSGKIKRSELFIVTKLSPAGNRPEGVEKWLKRSLENLQLDYVDLYLVHAPFAFEDIEGDLEPRDENGIIRMDTTTDHVKVWAELEKQVDSGRTRAIGLSNFNKKQIERILKYAKVPISMLQIELHVYFQQQDLVKYCREKNIPITAYSPLGSRELVKMIHKIGEIPDMLENQTILELGKSYNKTPAQIILRFIVQNGFVTIPKSTNAKRLKENIELFDWSLKQEDVEKLKSLHLGEKGRICDFGFLNGIKRHPEYPF